MLELELLEEKAKLIERNKELSCLFEIAKIVARTDRTLPEVLREIVAVLPSAFHYPDKACARITLDKLVLTMEGFEESRTAISDALIINGRPRGTIEVFYYQKDAKGGGEDNLFLPEEQKLLQTIARQVSLMIEIKLANEKKIELENQLRHADRLAKIGQLAAGVAHELNDPLASILGFAQLAAKKIDSPEQSARYIDRIIQSCLQAREIIKKMMLLSSPKSLNKSQLDLNRLLGEGMSFIEPRFVKSGIRFEYDFDPNLPSILADASQITQVLVNLVINAVHAMPNGGTLTLKTACVDGKVKMVVQDTGIGMDTQTIEQIFLPFFSTKDVDHGTGLGLSVVHGIVTAHGGLIDVKSQLGRGATFVITFPVDYKEENKENTTA